MPRGLIMLRGRLPLEGCQIEGEATDEPTHLTSDGDVEPPRRALTLCGKPMAECGWGESLLIVQWLEYGLCAECEHIARQLVAMMDSEG
jgi:hypothetical protein